MSEFFVYFELGIRHILDLNGYDHLLFVIALCAVYLLADWRKLLVLVTAFTLGHSLTLALSTFNLLRINSTIIEFLIPITIFITAIFNLSENKIYKGNNSLQNSRYFFALFFGLIHGMGFSNYLKSLLDPDQGIILQLFAFNAGLELGQLVIVFLFLIASYIFVNLFKLKKEFWSFFISGSIAIVSLLMIIQKIFFNS